MEKLLYPGRPHRTLLGFTVSSASHTRRCTHKYTFIYMCTCTHKHVCRHTYKHTNTHTCAALNTYSILIVIYLLDAELLHVLVTLRISKTSMFKTITWIFLFFRDAVPNAVPYRL